MKKQIVMMLALVAAFPTVANTCQLALTTDLPEQLIAKGAVFQVDFDRTPVSESQSICIDDKDLVSKHKFESVEVSVMLPTTEIPIELYRASIHNQTRSTKINATTHIATILCPRFCGFYEYEKLLNHPEVQAVAKLYQAKIENDPSATATREGNFAVLRDIMPAVEHLEFNDRAGAEQFPAMAPEDFEHHVDRYSGAWNHFHRESFYINKFSEDFRETNRADKSFAHLTNQERKQRTKAVVTQLKDILNSNKSWSQTGTAIEDAKHMASKMGDDYVQHLVTLMDQSYQKVDTEYQAFFTDSHTPFSELTDKSLSFEQVLAYWSHYAYNYSKDKKEFSALFSEHYRRNVVSTLIKDKQRDRALSGLMTLSYIAGSMNTQRGFRKTMHEYDSVNVIKTAGRYSFKDRFEKIDFVYENGAWRLDDVLKISRPGESLSN